MRNISKTADKIQVKLAEAPPAIVNLDATCVEEAIWEEGANILVLFFFKGLV